MVSDTMVSDALIFSTLVSDTMVSDALIFNMLVSDTMVSDALIFSTLVSDTMVSDALIFSTLVSDTLMWGVQSCISTYKYSVRLQQCYSPRGLYLEARCNGFFAISAKNQLLYLASKSVVYIPLEGGSGSNDPGGSSSMFPI